MCWVTFVVRDLGLADHMAYLPWITDGIASDEIAALLLLADKSFAPESAKSLVSYYWVKNGLNATETSAMESIVSVAKSDAQVASHILSLPWVANGITRRETEGLAHLEVSRPPTLTLPIYSLATLGSF